MRRHLPAVTPLALLLALVIPACEPGGVEEESSAPDTMAMGSAAQTEADVAADRAAIDSLRTRWQQGANADSAAAVAALYTRGARFLSSTGVVEGRQALQDYFEQSFAQSSNLQISSRDVQVSGDVAYGIGTFSQAVVTPAGEQNVEGDYLVVLRRQPNGYWLIDRHASVTPMPGDTMGGGMGGGMGAGTGGGMGGDTMSGGMARDTMGGGGQ